MIDTEAIKARCEAATPGPWRVPKDNSWRVVDDDTYLCNLHGKGIDNDLNAIFIACARDDIPALLAAHDEQAADIERLKAELVGWKNRAEEAEKENEAWNNTDCNTCPLSTWDFCDLLCATKQNLIDRINELSKILLRQQKAENLKEETIMEQPTYAELKALLETSETRIEQLEKENKAFRERLAYEFFCSICTFHSCLHCTDNSNFQKE